MSGRAAVSAPAQRCIVVPTVHTQKSVPVRRLWSRCTRGRSNRHWAGLRAILPDDVQPRRECSAYRRTRRVKIRAIAEHGDLCDACAPIPVNVCTVCGRERSGFHREGAFIGTTCSASQRPARERALCRELRLVNAEWPIGPVCAACYQRALRLPAPCVRCGRLRVLTSVEYPGSAPQLCCRCAGGQDYACATCDTPAGAYEHGRCARCVLSTRLHTTFADADGTPRGQYAVLVT